MSIKIFNAFELRGCSLEQALTELQKLRPLAYRKACEIVAKEVVERATLGWDAFQNGIESPAIEQNSGVSYLFAAALSIADEQEDVRRTQRKAPDVDIALSVCLIPTEGRVLGIGYGVRSDMRELLTLLPGYISYEYWDNQERPSEISEQEWDSRAKAWATALPGWCAPAEVGFSYALVSEEARPSLDAATAELVSVAPLPTAEVRAAALLGVLYDHGKTTLPEATSTRAVRVLLASSAWQEAKVALAAALPVLTATDLTLCPEVPPPVTSTYIADPAPEVAE